MKHGIYSSISEDDYHNERASETPYLSSSIAKILCAETPLHAWTAHPRLNPNFVREEKEAFDLGTVAHSLMLQGIEAGIVLDLPDWKTKVARETRDGLRAIGQIPILKKHWDRVKAMVESGKRQIAEHQEASDLFTEAGKAEQTILWFDEEFGVHCKSRLDWLRNDYRRIADYKTTGTSANPANMAKFVTSQGWDIQAAFYLRGLFAIKAVTEVDFLFAAHEDYPPYALSVVGLSEESLIVGAKKVEYAASVFAKCLKSGLWPAYPTRVCPAPFDIYDAEKWAARELRT